MSSSSVLDFVKAMKSDPLKARVVKAQREAMTNIRREADAIAAVARKEGFDLSEWAKRPTDGSLDKTKAEDCWFTCCVVKTSTT